ncbi:MAG: glycosyltransferase family 39 protein [Lachnospiraceae bacterium]|nr:glycosyltransferase family 39 protein [Lachnospiraceae bacterium]
MEKTVSEKSNSRKLIYIILGAMILLQVGLISYYFYTKKEGYHSDELWSYGYSNSYYQKDIFRTKDEQLVDRWASGKELKDYLVVNEGEQFKYDSVYSNQIEDLSPPFHSMVLHTVSSFFPNKFSKTFAFSINVVMFCITMIFLFKLCEHWFGPKIGLLLCFVYGLSQGAFDTTIYLRMYAMCTAFTMIIVYYMIRIVDMEEDKRFIKETIILYIVSLLAFLTHYYMISFCGILTALLCIYLVVKKQWKKMLKFGLTMTAAFLSSIVVFPSLLRNSSSQVQAISAQASKGSNLTFDLRTRTILSYMNKKVTFIETAIYKTNTLQVIVVCILAVLVFASPLLILFRENEKVRGIFRRIKQILLHEKKITCKKIMKRIFSINWIFPIFMIAIFLQIIVVGETTNVYAMGICVDRYIFYLYPLYLIFLFSIVKTIISWITKSKKISFAMLLFISIALIAIQQYRVNCREDYYFEKQRVGQDISEVVKGNDVIIVMDGNWRLTALCESLMDVDRYYMTNYKSLKMNRDKLIDGMDTRYKLSNFDFVKKYEEKISGRDENSFYVMINTADFNQEILSEDDYLRTKKQSKDLREYNNIFNLVKWLKMDAKVEMVSAEVYQGNKMELFKVTYK